VHSPAIGFPSRANRVCAAILGVLIGAGSASAQAQDLLANACTSCHGIDGHSTSAIPSIAGLDPAGFVQLMTGFRDDTIQVTVMNWIAKAYSAEQIRQLAQYFATR
jgi:sulfide dehydrogenase cytochrome subunit